MVTVIRVNNASSDKLLVDLVCLSTDSKPTQYMNGSMAFEMNTGKFFVFNEDGPAWVEVGA